MFGLFHLVFLCSHNNEDAARPLPRFVSGKEAEFCVGTRTNGGGRTMMKVFLTKTDASTIPPMEKWLSGLGEEERDKINRLRKEMDQLSAAAAHRLLQYGLRAVFGIVPAGNAWRTGDYGKPYLENLEGVHFNISHSGQMAMCAVGNAPVGADIERIGIVTEILARRILSEEEWDRYAASWDKVRFFYQVWTLKEAYFKYCGTGLTDDIKSITVCPDGSGIRSSVDGCQFVMINGIRGYQAAVCTCRDMDILVESVETSRLLTGF